MRPFRFGVIANAAASGAEWVAKARRAEALGYSTLLVVDHTGDQLSPIPAMAMAAAATTTLRVGSFVFANDFRNPVLLARELSTIDVLSGGRVEIGLGAGWMPRDYERLGIPYDVPKLRVDRMREALRLMKRLYTEESVTSEGPHYRVRDATALPRPVRRPHPPFMIGGGGRRVLRIAAREADIVAFVGTLGSRRGPRWSEFTERALARKVAHVREAAGARFDRVELNVIVLGAALTDTGSVRMRGEALIGAAANAPIRSPYVLYGSMRSVHETLLRRRDRLGISYYALPVGAMEAFAPLVQELSGK